MGRQGCSACKFPIELASSERVGFRDTCSSCRSDLHTCHNCAHHDPSAYNECRESSSERVGDRERANRCDYFAIGNAPAGAADESQQQTKNALEDLFKKS